MSGYPTVRATGADVAGTGAITVVWPTHVTDDIGILVIAKSGGQSHATPTGFSQIGSTVDVSSGVGSVSLSVWWKRATSSSEPNVSITDTGDHQHAIITSWRDCITSGNPFEGNASNSDGTGGTALTYGAVTTTDKLRTLIDVIALAQDTGTGNRVSAYVQAGGRMSHENFDTGSASGTGDVIVQNSFQIPTATSLSATTATATLSGKWAALSFALIPVTTTPSSPVIEGVQQTGFSSSGTTSHAYAIPAHSTGDLLIVSHSNNGGGAVTPPSGWTLIGSQTNGTKRLYIYAFVADGSEGSTVTFTTATGIRSNGVVFAFSNHNGITDIALDISATGTGTSADPANLTPPWGSAENAWIAYEAHALVTGASVWPTGYDYWQTTGNQTNETQSTGMKYATGSSDDPSAYTIASSAWIAATLAVRPKQTGGTFTLDSILRKTQTGSFTADAVLRRTQSATLTLDAIIRRTQTGSAALDAVLRKTVTGSKTLDAIIRRAQSASFTLDAVINATTTHSATFTLDAIVRRTQTASFTLNSVLKRSMSASFVLDAVIGTPGHVQDHFSLSAVIRRNRTGTFTLDAVLAHVKGFAFNAVIRKTAITDFFTLNAVIAHPDNQDGIVGSWVPSDTSFVWTPDTDVNLGQLMYAGGKVWMPVVGTTGSVMPDFSGPGPVVDGTTTWTVVPAWQAGHTYDTGDFVQPTTPNGSAFQNQGDPFTSGGSEPDWVYPPPPSTDERPEVSIVIRLNGVDITDDVIVTTAKFAMQVNGVPSTCSLRIKDLSHVYGPITGQVLTCDIDGIRYFDGFAMKLNRVYAFDVDDTTDAEATPRLFEITGVDINSLLSKRIAYYKPAPEQGILRAPGGFRCPGKRDEWAEGTSAKATLEYLIGHYTDLYGDGIIVDVSDDLGSPNPDACGAYSGAVTVQNLLVDFNRLIQGIFYINPDRVLMYHPTDVLTSNYTITDRPDPENPYEVGARDLLMLSDGSKLANDALVWGAALGYDRITFSRAIDANSINDHDRWQVGDFNQHMFRQATVDARADSLVYGIPDSGHGATDDRVVVTCKVFRPIFRLGEVVNIRLAAYTQAQKSPFLNFPDVVAAEIDLPIRRVEITFPTPTTAQFDLTITREIDDPFDAFEFLFPKFNYRPGQPGRPGGFNFHPIRVCRTVLDSTPIVYCQNEDESDWPDGSLSSDMGTWSTIGTASVLGGVINMISSSVEETVPPSFDSGSYPDTQALLTFDTAREGPYEVHIRGTLPSISLVGTGAGSMIRVEVDNGAIFLLTRDTDHSNPPFNVDNGLNIDMNSGAYHFDDWPSGAAGSGAVDFDIGIRVGPDGKLYGRISAAYHDSGWQEIGQDDTDLSFIRIRTGANGGDKTVLINEVTVASTPTTGPGACQMFQSAWYGQIYGPVKVATGTGEDNQVVFLPYPFDAGHLTVTEVSPDGLTTHTLVPTALNEIAQSFEVTATAGWSINAQWLIVQKNCFATDPVDLGLIEAAPWSITVHDGTPVTTIQNGIVRTQIDATDPGDVEYALTSLDGSSSNLLVKVKFDSMDETARVFLDLGRMDLKMFPFDPSGTNIHLTDSTTLAVADSHFNFAGHQWYNIRLYATGDTINAKIWAEGDEEPTVPSATVDGLTETNIGNSSFAWRVDNFDAPAAFPVDVSLSQLRLFGLPDCTPPGTEVCYNLIGGMDFTEFIPPTLGKDYTTVTPYVPGTLRVEINGKPVAATETGPNNFHLPEIPAPTDTVTATYIPQTPASPSSPPPPPATTPVTPPGTYAATFTGSGGLVDDGPALEAFLEAHAGQDVALAGVIGIDTTPAVTVTGGSSWTWLPGAKLKIITPGVIGIMLIRCFDLVLFSPEVEGTGFQWDGFEDPLQTEDGIEVHAGDRIVINDPYCHDTRGDGIYVGANQGGVTTGEGTLGLTINHPRMYRNSRNGITGNAGTTTVNGPGTIDQSGLMSIDLEPNYDADAATIRFRAFDLRFTNYGIFSDVSGFVGWAFASCGATGSQRPLVEIRRCSSPLFTFSFQNVGTLILDISSDNYVNGDTLASYYADIANFQLINAVNINVIEFANCN